MTRNQTEDPKVFNNKFALKMKESKPKVTFDFKQTSVIQEVSKDTSHQVSQIMSRPVESQRSQS